MRRGAKQRGSERCVRSRCAGARRAPSDFRGPEMHAALEWVERVALQRGVRPVRGRLDGERPLAIGDVKPYGRGLDGPRLKLKRVLKHDRRALPR